MTRVPNKREHADPTAALETKPEEKFLHRWSQRKHEARTSAGEIVPAAPVSATEPGAGAPAKVLTDADMPPLESLDENSDYSLFMSSGVSEALRRQALRKLFLLPSINQRCPLDSEYYDCRNLEPLGNIITHEMHEELEREAQKLKEAATELVFDDKNASAPRETNTAIPEVQHEKLKAVSESSVEKTALTRVDAAPRSRKRHRQRAKRSRNHS